MKSGLKVSGLVGSGRVAPAADVAPSTAFNRPVGLANAHHMPLATGEMASTFGAAELLVYDGNGIPEIGREILMPATLLDDSPYQTRLKISSARIDEIGAAMREAGQIDAIEVRFTRPGRAEIIKGHTRQRAALSIGWELVRVLPRRLTDQEAAKAVLIDNTGETPFDYEYGRSFRRLLDSKMASTQSELAAMSSMSQGQVSKCLSMLDLAPPVLALLNDSPGLFGVTTAANIQALWKQHPDNHDIILEGIKRFKEGAEQSRLKEWVAQQLARITAPLRKEAARRTILSLTGQPRYVRIINKREITIRLVDKELDMQEHAEKIEKFLESLVTHEE